MRLEEKIRRRLTDQGKTLSIAESCTGGLLAHRLTNAAGSSDYFLAGVTAYSNAAKTKILKVPAALLKRHGAVSPAVAEQMARNTRKIFKTDYAVGITGIAGPGGGTKTKPVGLVFIAGVSARKVLVKKYRFRGTRLQIKTQAAEAGLKMILKMAG